MVPGQQVGWARIPFQTEHAAMWHGSAASHIDMNPSGAGGSHLWATCGSAQVGDANIGAGIVAGIWFGTPESFVNLAAFLPGQWDRTYATSIVQQDGLYYVGGYGYPAAGGGPEAFYWVGVPAPGTGIGLLLGAPVLARRRRA